MRKKMNSGYEPNLIGDDLAIVSRIREMLTQMFYIR